MIQTRDITYSGVTFEVKFNATPGSPGRMYLANGDPGYPDEPPEVEILSVKLEGNDQDLDELFSEDRFDKQGKKLPSHPDEIYTLIYELDDLFEEEAP